MPGEGRGDGETKPDLSQTTQGGLTGSCLAVMTWIKGLGWVSLAPTSNDAMVETIRFGMIAVCCTMIVGTSIYQLNKFFKNKYQSK